MMQVRTNKKCHKIPIVVVRMEHENPYHCRQGLNKLRTRIVVGKD